MIRVLAECRRACTFVDSSSTSKKIRGENWGQKMIAMCLRGCTICQTMLTRFVGFIGERGTKIPHPYCQHRCAGASVV